MEGRTAYRFGTTLSSMAATSPNDHLRSLDCVTQAPPLLPSPSAIILRVFGDGTFFLVINPVDNLFRRSIATLSCCFFAPNWLALFASACCLIISRTILWRTNCVGCATQKDPPAFRGAPPSCQKPLAPILGFGIMYPLQNRGQKQHAQHADNL